MSNIEIRRLVEKDLESLAKLYKQFWSVESDQKMMKGKFQELNNNPKYIILCATINKDVVGSIMGIICDELYGQCRPFLIMEDLIVDKPYRKKGIGKALMTELENFAVDNGCTQIQFITENDRQDAISFYESLGYNKRTHIGFKKTLSNSTSAPAIIS